MLGAMDSPGVGARPDADAHPTVPLAAAADPRAVGRTLRANPVVHLTESMVMVTRRVDVEQALRQPTVFSSGMDAFDLGNPRPLIPLQIDPPRHVRYRRLLDPLFSPQKMAILHGTVAALADALIDDFAASGSCDLHKAFSVPLPCTVFVDLFGLPRADLTWLLAMKDGIIRPAGASIEERAASRRRTAGDIDDYFRQVVADRRVRAERDIRGERDGPGGGGDILHEILTAEVDGERLTEPEILDICFLFVLAGLDTVTDALDCVFAHLAGHPEDRRRLVADEALVPRGVEALLRWESPVPAVVRVATEDVTIGGCPIRSGQSVVLLIGSANTDSTADPLADVLDLDRDPNPHLAFGGGIHRCLGSHLARVELQAAVRQFHRRIPEYRLAPGTELHYTPGLRSLRSLPLTFEPRV